MAQSCWLLHGSIKQRSCLKPAWVAVPPSLLMHQCLAANQIPTQIQGIVNGTTNFMLTKMKRENMGFDAALKIAQQLGYAETKDPGDDVDGRDACKIAILSSLACGHHVYPDNIPARGIRDVTVEDVKAAEQLDAIKLIAWYHENLKAQLMRSAPVWSRCWCRSLTSWRA